MRNVRVQVSYDGSRFYGWQRQDGFLSVQEVMEDALDSLLGEKITVHGAGRTDTGVHAVRQVANFHVDTALEDERLLFALNAHLAEGVVIHRLETCRDDFHARFDAKGKRYLYLVATGRFRPPFGTKHCHWIREPLGLEAMRRAARAMLGRRDFRAFASSGSPRKSTVRHLRALHLVPRRERFFIVADADGFLYNMMRTIVGTLLEVGRGKLASDAIGPILASGDRRCAGPTAPPEGLYLLSVQYAEPCFIGRDRGPGGPPGAFPD